jgi:hypothetical protein
MQLMRITDAGNSKAPGIVQDILVGGTFGTAIRRVEIERARLADAVFCDVLVLRDISLPSWRNSISARSP